MKQYIYEGKRQFDHGCTDREVWQDNGDGTATCIESESCHSCWQVGHDANHSMSEVGTVADLDKVLDWIANDGDVVAEGGTSGWN